MVGPSPAVAAARLAVRPAVAECAGQSVVVAVSGGPDSMALLASIVFVAARVDSPCRVIAATVDHGWHDKSTQVAERAGRVCQKLAVEHHILKAPVATKSATSVSGGLEAHARSVRYELLRQLCDEMSSGALFIGHTRDDQAETVLMGLARGSGLRSLAGMEPDRGLVRRPFLSLSRDQTHAVCRDLGIDVWHDPANADPRFLRVRTRTVAIPVLSETFGQDVSVPLARTATLVRQDLECLDELADVLYRQARTEAGSSTTCVALDVKLLATAHNALLSRVVRLAALDADCPQAALGSRHIDAVVQLVTHWRGQGAIQIPGKVEVKRNKGLLLFAPLGATTSR